MSSSEGALASLLPKALVAGRFRVEGQLGRGGMGSIYRVVDERTGRKLAMKRLRASKSATLSVISTQFEREYHTLSQLAHPRIIEVYDYGVEDDEPYYTMELLDGQDLFERGKLGWRDACPILRDVASSLAILHSRRLLHRDISARNVRLTADGRAKLIDFGAMAPMGPVKHVVGTPPFLAPEALQKQALDGRTDLYALGALAYWVLTGRYAYPARSLEQLRELWQHPPPSPLQLNVEMPEALNQLVMELLQLERSARPATAAEVMERLSGIAGLSLAELPEVSEAYLNTPMLVGRDAQVKEVRATLSAAVQGRGSTVLIDGEEGTGRSRFLDACLLEAKLLGATVLRADATDGSGAEFGVARELCQQLLETLPELAYQSARLWRSQLTMLIPALATPPASLAGAPHLSAPAPRVSAAPALPNSISSELKPGATARPGTSGQSSERRQLQSALRNWVLLIARRRQLVIAVDDADSIDEASLSWLSALALAARRRRMSIVLTHRSALRNSPRLFAMRESAKTVTLGNLDLAQTEALLHSVFGDIDHVAGIAARIYGLSQGNPRWTMALAQSLVERKLARYEAGSWALPAQLASSDLPESLTSALAGRLEGLPELPLRLARALSLTDPALLPVESYVQLVPGATHGAALKALGVLVDRSVLVAEGAGYRFTQHELCGLLHSAISEESSRELHGLIAQAATVTRDSVLIARHLLLSGQGERAIERLLPARNDPTLSFSTRMLDVLQLAVDAARALRLSVLIRNELEEWLLAQAAVLGRLEVFTRYADALLKRMERDSGLSDYLEADPQLPEPMRLNVALAAARARYDAAAPHERGLPPEDAARRLGRVCSIITACAGVANELPLVERLPSLAPLYPICPALRIAQAHVATQLNMQTGRFDLVRKATMEVLELIDRRDIAIDPLYAGELRKACFYVLGLIGATSGIPGSVDWLRGLEQIPGMRVLAWRVRMAAEMALGHAQAAAECRKRAEVLLLEDASRLPYPGTTAAVELSVYSAADDVVGTKRAMERLLPMAEAFPGWRPHVAIARAQYLRIQGDSKGALEVLEPALRGWPACRHSQWGHMAELHVTLLSKLGRHEDAVQRGYEYLGTAENSRLTSASLNLLRALAEALAAAGRPADALPLIEENLRIHGVIGTRGLFLGRALETRARVAIAMRDEAGLRDYAERCAREYRGGRNLSLSAKYERLIREAESVGLALTTGLRQAGEVSDALLSPESAALTGSSRLLACISSVERVHEGLRLLLENSGAETGYVFGVSNEKLELRASLEQFEPDPGMLEALHAFMRRHLEAEQDYTTFDSVVEVSATPSGWTDSLGRYFEPMLLYGRRDNASVLAGVALLHYGQGDRSVMRRDLLDSIGNALLATDSVVS